MAHLPASSACLPAAAARGRPAAAPRRRPSADRTADTRRLLTLLGGIAGEYREAFDDARAAGAADRARGGEAAAGRGARPERPARRRRARRGSTRSARELDGHAVPVAAFDDRVGAIAAAISERTGVRDEPMPPEPPSAARGQALFTRELRRLPRRRRRRRRRGGQAARPRAGELHRAARSCAARRRATSSTSSASAAGGRHARVGARRSACSSAGTPWPTSGRCRTRARRSPRARGSTRCTARDVTASRARVTGRRPRGCSPRSRTSGVRRPRRPDRCAAHGASSRRASPEPRCRDSPRC